MIAWRTTNKKTTSCKMIFKWKIFSPALLIFFKSLPIVWISASTQRELLYCCFDAPLPPPKKKKKTENNQRYWKRSLISLTAAALHLALVTSNTSTSYCWKWKTDFRESQLGLDLCFFSLSAVMKRLKVFIGCHSLFQLGLWFSSTRCTAWLPVSHCLLLTPFR